MTWCALDAFLLTAYEKSIGVLLSIDLESGTLLLSDDITYKLPPGFTDLGFYAGDEVVDFWDMQDDVPIVEAITAPE